MRLPIALQLYSVRQECANDLFDVLKKVADMGYDGVEFAGYHGHRAEDIKMVLNDVGLATSGTHTGLAQLDEQNFEDTVELHHTLEAKFVIVPWMPEEMRNSPEACKKTGQALTDLTNKLKPHGLRLGFHAHQGDMAPLADGKSAWDHLAANTPDEFIMQYDTANGMAGGADPVRPILDWPGRSVSVHLKGYGDGFGPLVGEGTIPWKKVLDACESVGGTQVFVIEHEAEGEHPPMKAVELCLQNLKKLL